MGLLRYAAVDELAAIRARHESAKPNPNANPAWANAERDIAALLRITNDATLKAYESGFHNGFQAGVKAGQKIAERILSELQQKLTD